MNESHRDETPSVERGRAALGYYQVAFGSTVFILLIGFGLLEGQDLSRTAWSALLLMLVVVGALCGLAHVFSLWLCSLGLGWMWARGLAVPLPPMRRRLLVWLSLLIGIIGAMTLDFLLVLPWETGHVTNFAGRSTSLAALYQTWLLLLLPCLCGGFFAGQRWAASILD